MAAVVPSCKMGVGPLLPLITWFVDEGVVGAGCGVVVVPVAALEPMRETVLLAPGKAGKSSELIVNSLCVLSTDVWLFVVLSLATLT